jgi:hypothetical protein
MTMPRGWNPNLTNDAKLYLGPENVIWKNEVKTGIINRKVVETQVITNFHVLQSSRSIALSDLDDIVVMNQHRESQFQGGRYYVRGSGMSYGTGRSSGKTIGDIAFIYQGQPSILFQNIVDPSGVCRLAKAARRSMIQSIKLAEKTELKLQKEQERQRRLAEKSEIQINRSQKMKPTEVQSTDSNGNTSNIICQKCGSANLQDAKFCGMCGVIINSTCSKCGHSNPGGSGFCNACGFPLA